MHLVKKVIQDQLNEADIINSQKNTIDNQRKTIQEQSRTTEEQTRRIAKLLSEWA